MNPQQTENPRPVPADIPPEAAEKMGKAALRGADNRVSLLLLLLQLFAGMLAGVLALVWVIRNFRRIAGFPAGGTLQGLLQKNGGMMILLTYFSTFGAMVILIIIGRAMLGQKIFGAWRLPKAGPGLLFAGFALILGAALTGGLLSDGINTVFKLFGVNNASPNFSLNGNTVTSAVQAVYVCLVGPVLEETLFRGMILRRLLPFGEWFAIVASSVLFGVFHMNLIQAVPAALMGMVLAYMAVRCGSVLPGILVHMFNNSLSMIFTTAGYDKSRTVRIVYGALLFIGFAVSVWLIYRNRAGLRNLVKQRACPPVKHPYAVFFFESVSFWALIAFFILNCVSMALLSSGNLIQKFY